MDRSVMETREHFEPQMDLFRLSVVEREVLRPRMDFSPLAVDEEVEAFCMRHQIDIWARALAEQDEFRLRTDSS